MGVRLVLMGWWFLLGELRGLAGLAAVNARAVGRDAVDRLGARPPLARGA